MTAQSPAGFTPIGTEAEVCADIAERQQLGIAKYGSTVADNPLSLREWLQHAYEEQLDAAVYLKRAVTMIDARLDAARAVKADVLDALDRLEAQYELDNSVNYGIVRKFIENL